MRLLSYITLLSCFYLSLPQQQPMETNQLVQAGQLNSETSTVSTPSMAMTQSPLNGITYSPYLSDSCAPYEKVVKDLKTISQYAKEIRLYSTDCNQLENVLKAITEQKLNIKVMLGIWTRDGLERIDSELKEIEKVLNNSEYRSKITRISVGNEDLTNGISVAALNQNISLVKKSLKKFNIPIGTVEIGEKLSESESKSIIDNSDFLGVNIHPYFKLLSAIGGIDLTLDYLDTYLDNLTNLIPRSKLIISEIGLPSAGETIQNYGETSPEVQFEFLQKAACKLGDWNYFTFEAFDALFKQNDNSYGGVEQNYGILNEEGNLKAGTIERLLKC
ncbi:glycoside hydrolase family 17 protein [Conidiobolus coronatus NRRL 28638]|uniref:glucan endo-1,3-beta-D-glucosidase n=1 Tax=Conidiobolus coronatus (strain ATCC 28846 / CBS 209.66 / NRRL 28638) TaxID=796925 RepID=A0A137P5Y3_CONC2|nr:glycoside hydrolase family 17 protein [Conidiobolus coronatus NRRL 28638]|eukprot:KXN70379.1 glycoside hydrolase family 17 protein [Conidiobolus coronatus NRRL 28638]